MTKAQQILALYAECVGTMPDHKIPKHVAARLGTTDSYVRTVARQCKGRSKCEAEQRYWDSPLGQKMLQRRREISNETRRHRRITDPEFREREREHLRAYRRRKTASEGQQQAVTGDQ